MTHIFIVQSSMSVLRQVAFLAVDVQRLIEARISNDDFQIGRLAQQDLILFIQLSDRALIVSKKERKKH